MGVNPQRPCKDAGIDDVAAAGAADYAVFAGGPPAGSGTAALADLGAFAALALFALFATDPGPLQQASAIMSAQVTNGTRIDTAIQRRARRPYPAKKAAQ